MIEKFLLKKSFFREIECEITKYFELLTKSHRKFGHQAEL